MSSLAVGLGAALAASVALNLSFLVQHRGSAGAPAITIRRPLRTLRALLASRTWVVGAAVGLTGWGLHVVALAHAPLSLVQAFVAGGVALTVPMAAIGLGHHAEPRERWAAYLMVVALIALAIGLRGEGRHAAYDAAGLGVWLAGCGLVALGLATLSDGARRAPSLALAGGVLYGGADLAIKALTGIAGRHGAGGVVGSPWLAVAMLATLGAFFAFQRGLQDGRPVTAIALMTAATNVVTVAGGFVVFHDPLGRTPLLSVSHTAGFALVAISAWWLAPSQARLAVGPIPRG